MTLRIGIVVCFLFPPAAIGQRQAIETTKISPAEYEVFSAYLVVVEKHGSAWKVLKEVVILVS